MKPLGLSHGTIARKQDSLCSIYMSLILTVLISWQGTAQASSYHNAFDELLSAVRRDGKTLRRECQDEVHPDVTAFNIQESFNRAHRAFRSCKKVSYYLGIIALGNDREKKQARREIIDAYQKARDTYGAVNAANYYLGRYGNKNEEVRFQLLQIARSSFSTARDRDTFWERMILGINENQTAANVLFQNLVAENFYRDFPRSSYRGEVEAIHELAIKNQDRRLVALNKDLFRRGQYKAIIIRMQPVWSQADKTEIFPEALYMSIHSFIRLAQQVESVGQGRVLRRFGERRIDSRRVRELLEIESENSIEFAAQVQFLVEQATLLMDHLEKNTDPNNKWTRKAKKLFKNN